MFRQFLVVFVFQNGVFSFHNDNIPTSALIELINKVLDNERSDNIRYEKIGDRAGFEIDLEYYDFGGNFKEDQESSSDLLREEEDDSRSKEVRVHLIKNPEILEQYQNLLYYKRKPSGTKSKYQTKIYKTLTLEDLISHLRRNAAFRVDTISSENHKVKREDSNNDIKWQRSKNQDSEKKKDNFNDDFYEPKPKRDDWDIPTKNNKYNNIIEHRSKDTNRNSDIEWGSKKKTDDFVPEKKSKSIYDDDFQKNDKKPRIKDEKDIKFKPLDIKSDNFKEPKRKPVDSYGESNFKPIKSDNIQNFGSKRKESNFQRPLRLSEHIKPHYKPFKSSENKHGNDDSYKRQPSFKEPVKRYKPAYKEIYAPKMKDSIERRPREKKIDRNILGGTFGRTPIPYVGHRGIYEDK